MSKRMNWIAGLLLLGLLLLAIFGGCEGNLSPTLLAPEVAKGDFFSEDGEIIWYPQHEIYVRYQQDTFRVVAVNVDRRLGMISKGKRQVVRSLDSLAMVND